MKLLRLLACVFLALPCVALAQTSSSTHRDGDVSARVQRVLTNTPVIDGHNDLPWEIRTKFGNVGNINLDADTSDLQVKTDDVAHKVSLMTDIPRLRTGHVGAQFWSVWVPPKFAGPKAVEMTLQQIDIVRNMCHKYPKTFAMAYTAADIKRIEKDGKIACLIGVEGGHQIDSSLQVLREMYVLGARYMTLTHWKNTPWADSANDKPEHHGLTEFGRTVVHEMNRLGMLVDLSHVSADTMRDAITASQAPVMFSHSGARAVVDNPRDVPDDVLRMVKNNHGIVMVNFYPPFVSEIVNQWSARHTGVVARFQDLYSGQPDRANAAVEKWEHDHPRPTASISQVADHIEHIRKVAGVGSVGIGSDFDGIGSTPVGLDGVDKYPALFEELAHRGWTDADLADLAGDNLLRVMHQAEKVAKHLQTTEDPAHATLVMDSVNP